MPDITMCKDETCSKKDKCFRYIAEPNPDRQSYFTVIVRDVQSDYCDYYKYVERTTNA
jgi:hypothetical protein